MAPEVRVIDNAGGNLGVMSTRDAINLAREQEMDLVEINPKAEPPIVKIANFHHFKYQKEKELRKQKIGAHVSEIKGIRLSIRISEHDMEIKMGQAEKFLNRGDKAKVEVILRGREKGAANLGFEIISRFFAILNEKMPLKYDQDISRQGGKIFAVIAKK